MNKVDVKQLKTAKSYSNALYETAKELNKSEKIQKELEYITEIINTNNDLKEFFVNPVVSKNDKKEVINKVFDGIISKETLNFLFMLSDRSRLDLIETILVSYTQKVDRELNIEKPVITSAIELSEEYKKRISNKLEERLHSKIIPQYKTDKDIIGGLIIEVKDKTLDFSLRTKFKNMTKQLTKG